MSIQDLKLLNWFSRLEELWILGVKHFSSDPKVLGPKVILDLPYLKKLAFSLYFYSEYGSEYPSVVLYTPSLEDVRVERGLQRVQFKFGATVERLQIGECELTLDLLHQFLVLKNLKSVSCTDPNFLKAFDILKFKPDLKRIELHRHESGNQFDVIERLLEQNAKRSQPVEIYFEGELVNDTSDLWKLMKLETEFTRISL